MASLQHHPRRERVIQGEVVRPGAKELGLGDGVGLGLSDRRTDPRRVALRVLRHYRTRRPGAPCDNTIGGRYTL
jgi:hypothetical protein